MPTLNNNLITNTTTTINDSTVEYSSRKGFSRSYSILGLIVNVETTKERGWNRYETRLVVASKNHYCTIKEFDSWYKNEFKTSLGIAEFQSSYRTPITYAVSVERHTPTRIAEAHTLGVVATEGFVLTIINKYLDILFTQVNDEVITRQIADLQSQLSTTTKGDNN